MGQKILVIDDEQEIRDSICEMLGYEGFEATSARDGREGVSTVKESKPDLIICDIMMPELDGIGVLNTLRANPDTQLIPFIFLTAKVSVKDIRLGMSLGADDYVTKPYDADSLLETVHQRLQRSQRHAEEISQQKEAVTLEVAAMLPKQIEGVLGNIQTVANLIQIQYEANEPGLVSVRESLQRDAASLHRLVSRLNLYAQLPALYARRFDPTTGTMDTQDEVLAANDFIRETVLSVLKSRKYDQDVEFNLEADKVCIRKEHLAIIVEELVDNAIKFSTGDKSISVRTHMEPAFSSLTIMNEGKAPAPEQVEKIAAFKQFFDGERPAGLGLGLSLVQGIVRLYGGEFEIKSHGENRVQVSVLLPYQENPS